MSETIRITVNGLPTDVAPGTMLLDAIRDLGVQVPTLCHHPALQSSGACRLCVVEITHKDWGGWSGLVTSCLYPVEDGLEVSTTATKVRETRRNLLELYLSRCPDSEAVQQVARTEGVDVSQFPVRADADKCIQCDLCVRVCNELSTAALAPLGRGTHKTVGPRPDSVGEDCVGCLACAEICPTGQITYTRNDGVLNIWNRDFPIDVCTVNEADCRGCGACEEICPFAIPRISARRGGAFVAGISADTCTGCGICAGSCPTGAITQTRFTDAAMTGYDLSEGDLKGRVVTFACERSEFKETDDVITVPCVGRTGVDEIMSVLSRGADGVQLMCRDRDTCPYGPGGHLGEKCATVANTLATNMGLGAARVAYTRPDPGRGGPDRAAAAFRQDLKPSPLQQTFSPVDADITGLDRVLMILNWLKAQPELRTQDHPVAELDLLLRNLLPDWRLDGVDTTGTGVLPEAYRDAFRFRITHEQRRELIDALKNAAPQSGCATPMELAQIKVLTRKGAWLAGVFDVEADIGTTVSGGQS
jgi:bidirectional [NiFe] hydrogenase diaphorase subunit